MQLLGSWIKSVTFGLLDGMDWLFNRHFWCDFRRIFLHFYILNFIFLKQFWVKHVVILSVSRMRRIQRVSIFKIIHRIRHKSEVLSKCCVCIIDFLNAFAWIWNFEDLRRYRFLFLTELIHNSHKRRLNHLVCGFYQQFNFTAIDIVLNVNFCVFISFTFILFIIFHLIQSYVWDSSWVERVLAITAYLY